METIKVKRLNETATLPTRNNTSDAGIDLYALEDVFIEKGTTALIRTGIALNVPSGHVGKIEDRSSMAVKGLRTGGGVVDAGYNGEVKIVIHNLTNDSEKDLFLRVKLGYVIRKGDKVAQLLIHKIETPKVIEVNSLEETQRGTFGFGSSGR